MPTRKRKSASVNAAPQTEPVVEASVAKKPRNESQGISIDLPSVYDNLNKAFIDPEISHDFTQAAAEPEPVASSSNPTSETLGMSTEQQNLHEAFDFDGTLQSSEGYDRKEFDKAVTMAAIFAELESVAGSSEAPSPTDEIPETPAEREPITEIAETPEILLTGLHNNIEVQAFREAFEETCLNPNSCTWSSLPTWIDLTTLSAHRIPEGLFGPIVIQPGGLLEFFDPPVEQECGVGLAVFACGYYTFFVIACERHRRGMRAGDIGNGERPKCGGWLFRRHIPVSHGCMLNCCPVCNSC